MAGRITEAPTMLGETLPGIRTWLTTERPRFAQVLPEAG
jgi:hypothetical protein